MWAEFKSTNPNVNLVSREVLKISGRHAVQRIFSMPSGETGERMHIMQVYFVNDLYLYQFAGIVGSAEEFQKHRAEIEKIISSITIEP